MVKGVNKQIIEVKNTDSLYFEKAVFYLRAGVRTLPDEISQREIERYIADSGRSRARRLRIGRVIVWSALAAVILGLIVLFVR